MACTVCFEDFEEDTNSEAYTPPLLCINSKCNAKICTDCFGHFLKVADSMVKCVGRGCKSDYSYTLIKSSLGPDAVKLYRSMIMKEVKELVSGEIRMDTAIENLIDEVCKEKRAYIHTEFPVAIQNIVDILYKKEMNSVSIRNKKKIAEIVNGGVKPCPLYYCVGKLNKHGACFNCKGVWCAKCEAKVCDDSHSCKKEDIESVNAVKKCVKCPKCKIAVLRSFGCNFITCAVCKTNFDYITGKITQAGNHHDVTVTVRSLTKLSGQKNIDESVKALLIHFESLAPYPDRAFASLKLAYKNRRSEFPYSLYDRYNTSIRKSVVYAMSSDELWTMHNADKLNDAERVLELMIQAMEED